MNLGAHDFLRFGYRTEFFSYSCKLWSFDRFFDSIITDKDVIHRWHGTFFKYGKI